VGLRSPQLYEALKRYCLGAFACLYRESQSETPLQFAFEEHAVPDRPALYDYRPLARGYVEARADQLRALDDAQFALEELGREPAAAIFAHAHAGPDTTGESALFRTILLPFLSGMAERCGGFEWDDQVFNRGYLKLERQIFGERHAYGAVAPLVGISSPLEIELGRGLRVRMAAMGEIAAYWPEANGLLPAGFGREAERACVIELACEFPAGAVEPPDAPGEIADAVTALRLATAAPIAAGPVLFERLDWRPYGVRPVLPIAATEPPGEPTRLDEFRGKLAAELLAALAASDGDDGLGEALDRWELSLFAAEPYRSEQLRESLAALLGAGDGLWAAAARLSVLVGEDAAHRGELFARLRGLTSGGHATKSDADTIRRALVEVLMAGDRIQLVERLDDSLLGLKPRPRSYFSVSAVAS
jgi:hypothetical protein